MGACLGKGGEGGGGGGGGDADGKDYDYLYKVILVGDPSVGKSSFIVRYTDGVFTGQPISTIADEFKIQYLNVLKTKVKLQIWDTAGTERYRQLTTSYYRAASAAVLFFDLTNKQSFDNIQRWKQEVTEGSNSNTSGTPVTFIMVGTKTDLTAERVVSPEQAASLAERIGVKYFEASSKDNIGIAESVEGLVQELLEAEGIKVASD